MQRYFQALAFGRGRGRGRIALLAAPVSSLCLGLFLCLWPGGNAATDKMVTSYMVGASRIDIQIASGPLEVSHQELMQWIQWAADSVKTYYGRYPVPEVRLRIIPTSGQGVRGGTTFGEDNGGFIRIHVGGEAKMSDLAADWMLTHEMVHLGFPSMSRNHHWIEEGIATYVEPIARVRAGHLDVYEMWFDLVRDLDQGLPQPGDQGLDNTHTWARTYWGGALFCFLADVEIRKQTNNRKGLDDALRGILDAGGDIRQDWQLADTLRIGDQAVGVPVLVPLYDKMKDQPYDVDLAAMWRDLGVERSANAVRFIDSAPLAKTREAITYGSSAPPKSTANPR